MVTILMMSLKQVFLPGEKLINNSKLFLGFVDTYREVFNAKGEYEWAENWDLESAESHLLKSLRQKKCENYICLLLDDENEKNKVAGFSLGRIGKPVDAIDRSQLPYDLNENSRKEAKEKICERLAVMTKTNILYFQEFGIHPNYRSGGKRVTTLAIPLVSRAIELGVPLLAFWTSKHSKLFFLLSIFNIQEIFHFHDMQENIFITAECLKYLNILELSEEEQNSLLGKMHARTD